MNLLRKISRKGSWQKTKLAVFPALQKVSLGMEIPLILCFFAEKSPEIQIGGFTVDFL